MTDLVKRWEPAVPKTVLYALAGLMWGAVGVMLCRLAWGWLRPLELRHSLLLGLGGFIAALLIYRFGFSRIVARNIARLAAKPDPLCIFAFQARKSYLVIVIMVSMGIILRRSAIPKHYLAVLYIAMGVALFLGGLGYFAHLIRLRRGTEVT
ncbi:MAG TPA: hypothetical protein G4O02_05550 [Caldilineae bacterium]|nr:hypothetical protein [Caldilineae bacterium]